MPANSPANPKNIPSRATAVFALIALVITVFVITRKNDPGEELSDDLTHTLTRGDLVVSVTEQGTLESSNNTEIRNKVRGFSIVNEVVDVGTDVKQGQVLVRLDTKTIQEQLETAQTNVNTAKANLARSQANRDLNKIAIEAYNERYKSQLEDLKRTQEIAESRLENAKRLLNSTEKLYQMTYANRQELQSHMFSAKQFKLELDVLKNSIYVLNTYTKEMRLTTLTGNYKASQTKFESDEEALKEEVKRYERIKQELEDCVIRAPRDGLVIYPSAAAWKRTPDIDEGASVRMDQVVLLMPDLTKMQIKVGIHESVVDRLRVGMKAKITLSDQEDSFEAVVSKVANVTKPAGWWTGNVVKYDTIIKLPNSKNLKPGMTAKVEVILAENADVLKIPVAAIVELADASYCWVKTEGGVKKRKLELGDSDDIFVAVLGGVEEGEKVVLNPLARVEEAQSEAQKLIEKARSYKNR